MSDCTCDTTEITDGDGRAFTMNLNWRDTCPTHGYLEPGQPGKTLPGRNDKGHWTPEQLVTDALVEAVASARFNKPHTCAWEAIDPLTQGMLRNTARALLQDAIPALLAAGWTPPRTGPASAPPTPPG